MESYINQFLFDFDKNLHAIYTKTPDIFNGDYLKMYKLMGRFGFFHLGFINQITLDECAAYAALCISDVHITTIIYEIACSTSTNWQYGLYNGFLIATKKNRSVTLQTKLHLLLSSCNGVRWIKRVRVTWRVTKKSKHKINIKYRSTDSKRELHHTYTIGSPPFRVSYC